MSLELATMHQINGQQNNIKQKPPDTMNSWWEC
jgi:hypothetical protein